MVCFGVADPLEIIKAVTLAIPINTIMFHVIPIDTPFLLYLKGMDKLKVYFNNTCNEFVKRTLNSKERIKVFRKWGYL